MRSAIRSVVASAMLLVAALASACGGPARYTPTATSRAAGTDAAMSVERDEDQHTAEVELVVEHLAPASRIQEGATAFVVWARQGTTGSWTRVGVLVYENDTRTGSITASVPFETFELTVTAEREETARQPSDVVVLRQSVQ